MEKEKTLEKKVEKKDKKSLFSKLFKKKEKPNEIPVIYLRNTGKAEIRYVTPKAGLIELDGKMYHLKPGSDWELYESLFNKKKILIVPEWGMYPLGPEDYLKELKNDAAKFQHDVIRAIQHAQTIRELEELERRKNLKLSPGVIIAGIIGLIIVIAFIANAG